MVPVMVVCVEPWLQSFGSFAIAGVDLSVGPFGLQCPVETFHLAVLPRAVWPDCDVAGSHSVRYSPTVILVGSTSRPLVCPSCTSRIAANAAFLVANPERVRRLRCFAPGSATSITNPHATSPPHTAPSSWRWSHVLAGVVTLCPHGRPRNHREVRSGQISNVRSGLEGIPQVQYGVPEEVRVVVPDDEPVVSKDGKHPNEAALGQLHCAWMSLSVSGSCSLASRRRMASPRVSACT